MAVSPLPASELKTAALSVAAHSVPPTRLKALEGTSSKIDERVAELQRRRTELVQGGGKQRIDKQHAMGKLTARERVDKLVDRASFQEIGIFAKHRATLFGMSEKETPADGVITGCATVDGRLVHLASQDFTVLRRHRGRDALRQDHRDDAALPEDRQPFRLHQRFRRSARAGRNR